MEDELMRGVGRLGLSSFNIRRSSLAPKLQVSKKESGPKDLVSFFEALNAVLDGRPWLNFMFANSLDGAYLGGGTSFIVRRHILQRRIHSPPHRKVPGEVVVLKISRETFLDGHISGEDATSERMNALIKEILILAHPPVRSSPNVVDLLQLLFELRGSLLRPVLILEYADMGTLKDFLGSQPTVSVNTKNSFCKDIARGIYSLHKSGILHGDIKCENVLLFRTGEDKITAKLTDFGFSVLLSELDDGSSIMVGGTDPYRAPEADEPVRKNMIYKTDYYSLGMLIWQLLLPGCPGPFACSPFNIQQGVGSTTAWLREVQLAKRGSDFLDRVLVSVLAPSECDNISPYQRILCQLLSSNPAERNIVNAFEGFDSSIASDFLYKPSIPRSRNHTNEAARNLELEESQVPSQTNLKGVFNEDSLDFSRFDTVHFAVKAQILSSLKYHADEKSPSTKKKAAEASYLLSQCYLNGFGLPDNNDSEGLRYLRRAVKIGHSIAREVAFNVCQALGADTPDIYPALNVATSDRKVRPKEERSPISENVSIDQIRLFMGQVPEQVVHYNEDGDNLLHWAAAHDCPDIAEMILNYDPNLLEANNNLLETPLLFACRHGSTGVLKVLLERGAKTDKISLIGETALHWLVSFPEAEIKAVNDLIFDDKSLRSFALPSHARSGHFGDFYICGTPLHRAVALRRLDVVKLLLDRGADPFFAGDILFDQEALAQAGFEPIEADSNPSYLPIHWACQAHDSGMLSALLSDPASFQIPEWPSDFELSVSPFVAEGMPRKTLSDWVLPIGITMNRNNRTEFATAAWDYLAKKDDGLGCPIFMSTSLLGYACNPLPRFTRLATYGEKYKDAIKTIDMIGKLRGQFLSRVSFSGMTAIMQAVRNSDTETCLYLLAKKDVPETLETCYKGGWGLKPLHVAALNNNVKVFRALLNAGADPRAQRTNGITALHVIASEYFQDQSLAEELISAAPDLVHADQALETPFSTAVRNSDFPLADFLRSRGASVNQLLGPHHTNTALFQVLAGSSNSDIDLEALRYLLAIPELDFVVAPKPQCTALHAAVVLPVRYALDGLTAPSTSNHATRILLQRWHSKSDLMMRDHKGNTALHYAAMFRDISSTKLLVEAMVEVGANINTLSDYLGSPVNMSVLDALDLTNNVPSSIAERGEGGVAEWNQQTAELERILEQHGAKRRSALLEERWSELSFFDKQKANLLSNQKLAPLAQGIQILDLWWSLGPDVRTTRSRIESERNPEEVSRRWFGS